eukprot:Gregarina_sp_Poly_1__2630@NODE_1717_length_3472_cov_715_164170_g1125_i0_p2_GENE_NODE_1717_length_3472_cov_715_164170_g1125_i0NODE_1717_length_3472_cov_715_164170_g1125_i0_p2_ORF_typecomplete_len342_score56_53Aldo_ket_red/PF00248_21/7_2e48T4_deiodinase/PF00837_17/0_1IMS_C/PF11799_8/0_41Myb_DNAbind_6/PF13921_6/9_5e03Myb_DNAbind_6/PF13921_6/0_4_NODE_1717_length_3472_cov_715_164170_g1125_i01211146
MTEIKNILCAKLHNGVLMPALGFGTWELSNTKETSETISSAIQMGYRHIDTALAYENHQAVGEGIRLGEKAEGLQRAAAQPVGEFVALSQQEFEASFSIPHGEAPSDNRKTFLTSKVFTNDFTEEGVTKAIDRMTEELGRSVDLVLLHWPGAHPDWNAPASEPTNPKNPETRIECWRALEKAYAAKKVRAIGVSNYAEKHLIALINDVKARRAKNDPNALIPMINQFELSPLCSPRRSLLDIMRNHNIMATGYSTLGSYQNSVLKNETILEIAKTLNRTATQITLRWCLQNNYLCIPRTSNKAHAEENIAVTDFELDTDTLDRINALHCGFRRCPDPMEFV